MTARARFKLDARDGSPFASMLRVLEMSPAGNALIRTAQDGGLSIGCDPLLEPGSYFFYPAQRHLDLGTAHHLTCLIGGLRHCVHAMNGQYPDADEKDFARRWRVMEADIVAITHLIAWELRAAGAASLWRHLLGGGMHDIAHVFEHAAPFNSTALAAAFHQWFVDETRIAACNRAGAELLDMAELAREKRGLTRSNI